MGSFLFFKNIRGPYIILFIESKNDDGNTIIIISRGALLVVICFAIIANDYNGLADAAVERSR